MDIYSNINKNIIYKKNALNELSSNIKIFFPNKKILFLSSNNGQICGNILSQISKSGNIFRFCYINNKLSLKSQNELLKKLKEFDLFIGYGNDLVINYVKYFASMNGSKYIIIPSAPSSFLTFTNYYYDIENKLNFIKCDLPAKIFIDEDIIKSAVKEDVISGYKQMLSLNEFLFCAVCSNEVENGKLDVGIVAKCISRFKDIYNQFMKGDNEANLILMDNMIEMSAIIGNISPNDICVYNEAGLLEKASFCKDYDFDYSDYMLLASDILLNSYNIFLSYKEIKQFEVINFFEISSIIESYGIKPSKIKTIKYFNHILDNKNLFEKFNELKPELKQRLEIILQNYKANLKLINKGFGKKISVPNLDSCYSSLKILPFIFENNFLINLVASTGLLNY